jgi:hypothetical protein
MGYLTYNTRSNRVAIISSVITSLSELDPDLQLAVKILDLQQCIYGPTESKRNVEISLIREQSSQRFKINRCNVIYIEKVVSYFLHR